MAQLEIGWRAWRELNVKAKDWNYTLEGRGMQALQGDEATIFKCVWSRQLGDDWRTYLRSYNAGVAHLYLRIDPTPELLQLHSYRPVAKRVKV